MAKENPNGPAAPGAEPPEKQIPALEAKIKELAAEITALRAAAQKERPGFGGFQYGGRRYGILRPKIRLDGREILAAEIALKPELQKRLVELGATSVAEEKPTPKK